jgi:hypothetical protein
VPPRSLEMWRILLLLQAVQVMSEPASSPTYPQLKPYFEDANAHAESKNQNTPAPTLAPTAETVDSGVFAPSKPLSIHAEVVRSTFVTMTWTPPISLDNGKIKVPTKLGKRFEYQLQWCEDHRVPAGPGTTRTVCEWKHFSGLGPGQHSAMTVGDLKPGTHYMFRVRAAEPQTAADRSKGFLEIRHKWGAWNQGSAVTSPKTSTPASVNLFDVAVLSDRTKALEITLQILVPCHTGADAVAFQNQQVRRVQVRHRPTTAPGSPTHALPAAAAAAKNVTWELQRAHEIDATVSAKTEGRDRGKAAARVFYRVTGLLPGSSYELQVRYHNDAGWGGWLSPGITGTTKQVFKKVPPPFYIRPDHRPTSASTSSGGKGGKEGGEVGEGGGEVGKGGGSAALGRAGISLVWNQAPPIAVLQSVLDSWDSGSGTSSKSKSTDLVDISGASQTPYCCGTARIAAFGKCLGSSKVPQLVQECLDALDAKRVLGRVLCVKFEFEAM